MDKKEWNFQMRRFPQNYIISNPEKGSVIFFGIIFLFLILYRPVEIHSSTFLNVEVTMLLYSLLSGVTIYLMIIGFKKLSRNKETGENWNLLKELVSIILLMIGLGSVIFLSAFIIEEPGDRWNLSTYFDSLIRTALVGLIPFLFFTVFNLKYLTESSLSRAKMPDIEPEREKLISIDTPLKKEELKFYPSQLIYAESQGNYLKVVLEKEQQVKEIQVRCSISGFEEQCSSIPFIMRIHRAFIINLNKIDEARGNSLGYRLKIGSINSEIPVSRGYADKFKSQFGS